MSAADKLAQVLAEHGEMLQFHAVAECNCGEHLWDWQEYYNETPDEPEDAFRAHQAAVVLAHLTAEGWAQGREQWGVQVHIASVAGRGTRVEPVDTEEQARDPYRHVFVAHGETIESKTPVRRRVTDWEPVEGEHRG